MRGTVSLVFAIASLFVNANCLAAPKNKAATPPPSQPEPAKQDKGPSLDATLNFVRSKLELQGNFEVELASNSASFKINASNQGNFVKDPTSCEVGVANGTINLKEVTKISLMPCEQFALGVMGAPATCSRQVTFLKLGTSTNRAVGTLMFLDQDDASRVAKALTHAIELCGGGNEPF